MKISLHVYVTCASYFCYCVKASTVWFDNYMHSTFFPLQLGQALLAGVKKVFAAAQVPMEFSQVSEMGVSADSSFFLSGISILIQYVK